MSTYQQNPDGTWSPAEPIGWREEHNPWQRLLLWVLRRPHCCDEEQGEGPANADEAAEHFRAGWNSALREVAAQRRHGRLDEFMDKVAPKETP